jgi:hypothetical protein
MYWDSAVTVGAAVVVALGLSGCSHGESASPSSSVPLPSSAPAAAPQAAVLPAPEALTDVLYRLADPAVPGADKLNLVEGAKPDDTATLDKFATALKDGGYVPLTFEATDIAWSEQDPGNATATINVTTPNPETSGFSFPMEFTPRGDGWQLSQKTAEMLLALVKSRAGAPPASTPGPTPTP